MFTSVPSRPTQPPPARQISRRNVNITDTRVNAHAGADADTKRENRLVIIDEQNRVVSDKSMCVDNVIDIDHISAHTTLPRTLANTMEMTSI
jgi:hypothetical protein